MSFFRRFAFRFDPGQKASLPKGEVVGLRYFQAAMGVLLLIGAFWGTFLLWRLSEVQEFTHMNLFEVNAHGQGQIYGWLGLALMGACYRSLAPSTQISFAYAPLILILLGIGLNMAGLYWYHSPGATVAGGLCLIGAALLFSLQIYPCISKAEKGFPPFLRAGLAFFFISTLYSLWHHQRIAALGIEAQVFQQVANFQAPLRDLQIHGMALFLVLGLFSSTKTWKGFGFLLFGVIGELSLFLIYRMTGQSFFAALLILPWLSLFIGALVMRLVFRWPHRWLILSLAMLLVLPLYSLISHQTFSHAYYGAIRHAITVGCFSQMALLFMPVRSQTLFSLAIVFLNVGCLLRVALQILSDFHPIGFSLIPLSGAIEFFAFIIACRAFTFLPSTQNVCAKLATPPTHI